ncbi:MAG: hypothetical protein GY866_35700 [Proteobacteria bacterium]|nr:hypothetical protein [Pseudomonadota bacterium]
MEAAESYIHQDESLGFVSLFDGTATYEGRGEEKNAIGSFFLVRLFDGYDFYLGALTYASFDSFSNTMNETRENGDSAEVTLNTSMQHRAYGTMVGYVYNSNTFLAWQLWGGAGYVNNLISFETDINELVTDSSNNVYQCSGSTTSTAQEVSSFPYFIGFGITLNDFGFFVQMMTQDVDPIEITHSGTITCNRGPESDSHSLEHTEDLEISYSSTQIGIQYWF